MAHCPCGLPHNFARCCGRFIAGSLAPETAEQLMRSRYTAYVRGAVDYLIATTALPQRQACDRTALVDYCQGLRGVSLQVVATVAGGPGDPTGEVTFIATLRHHGQVVRQHERSQFAREDNRWVYSHGTILE